MFYYTAERTKEKALPLKFVSVIFTGVPSRSAADWLFHWSLCTVLCTHRTGFKGNTWNRADLDARQDKV